MMIKRMRSCPTQIRWLCCVSLGLLPTACAVGPNFHRPTAPNIQHYAERPIPASTVTTPTIGGASQHFKINQKIAKQWWTVFRSPALERLINESLQANPDMRAAAASLQMAHEATKVARTAFFPLLTGNYSPVRQQTAGTLASNLSSNAYLYTLTTQSLSVGYLPDVFGITRRRVESAAALEESALYQYEAVYLTLSSNVVLSAINEASLRGQVATTERIIKILRELLQVLIKQKNLGDLGVEAVAEQEVFLAQAEASLSTLRLQLAQNRHLLASLSGQYSSEHLDVAFTLRDFVLPRDLPLSLPSQLIDNRPDIRAAEANMHAASAQIGVAIANRLPSISISANGGYLPVTQSLNSIPYFLAPLPTGPSLFWNLGANLLGTLFDAGSLYFQQRSAEAAYNLSVDQYKRVVLNAFQSVADSLKALQLDAEVLQHTKDQVDAAETLFNAVKHKHQLGSASYLQLLFSERAYLAALLSLVQSQSMRFSDTVALFQALGGGWSMLKEGELDKPVGSASIIVLNPWEQRPGVHL
ncbi:MAG: efflux transporter outer membrane subunit [Legionellales bacterium]|nr:efflux transporter outer membrane subunit [Legionellales bacterium]